MRSRRQHIGNSSRGNPDLNGDPPLRKAGISVFETNTLNNNARGAVLSVGLPQLLADLSKQQSDDEDDGAYTELQEPASSKCFSHDRVVEGAQ